MKCEYCSNDSVTIHNDEPLCKRHYYTFYSERLDVKQLSEVSKIKEEKVLSEKYIKIMNSFNFYSYSKTNGTRLEKIIKKFKKETKRIALKNPLYYGEQS